MQTLRRAAEAPDVRRGIAGGYVNHFRLRLWELLEVTFDSDTQSTVIDWYDRSLATLIVLNVLAVILESVRSIGEPFATAFYAFEVFSVAVFTIEYVLRIWSCTADSRYSNPVLGRIRYALTPMVLIDLLSFAPFYLVALPFDLRFLRVMRLFRLLRVLKLGRYSDSLSLVTRVLRRKRSDLVAAVVVLLVMLVLASSVMYYVEREAQPDVFSSIPAAMWWGVVTFTTVGYGDVYPVTPLGKVLGSLIALLGIGLFALPAGILASGFSEERERVQAAVEDDPVCPHCGQRIG
ncbi:MAG: ion transporter [Actinobacteria bacterium]|nr:ion transporter [Actinomycetota bacterium]